MTTYIGIDNGVSGSIGIISNKLVYYHKTPVKKELNYTKVKKWLNRIDISELKSIFTLNGYATSKYSETSRNDIIVYVERPMVNPGRFQATVSALRALEATLIVLEELRISYQYIDSKEWQKILLPKDLKGEELKEASLQIGKRLFPKIDFKGFKDADGLLIAEYARRTYENNTTSRE